MAQEFEWDEQKAEEELENHGVALEEALTVFADPLANIFDDPDHSAEERPELIIGHSVADQWFFQSRSTSYAIAMFRTTSTSTSLFL